MVCTGKSYSQTHEKEKTCSVKHRALISRNQEVEEKDETKEERKAKKGRQCDDAKPPSKKKFLEIGPKQICAMPYTRKWKLEGSPEGPQEELPKWFSRRKPTPQRGTCRMRELDDYVKGLWTPFCKPREKPVECRDPIDQSVCVICLEGLYTGGYIHDLFEKVPLIKKQSEIYGDEVAWRIGLRTRVPVHKKCYSSYIDTFMHKAEGENEVDVDLGNDEIEESEDLNCAEEEEEEEEGGGEGEGAGEGEDGQNIKDKEKQRDKQAKDSTRPGVSENLRKQNFCLQKFKIPGIHPGR